MHGGAAEGRDAPLDEAVRRSRGGAVASGRCARRASAPPPTCPASATTGPAGRTPRCRPSGSANTCASFRELLDEHDYRAALYGHFGDGCVHCRINFDLRTAGGLRTWRRFLDEAADLVVEHGGSLSGEHGDGQQRAELLPKMYGPELVGAFDEMKRIWDPDNRMNPHKVVDPYPIVSNMKLGSGYSPPEVDTHFAYGEDGGSFAHAALRCVGAGKCRDDSQGTMCPSFMATRDEEHTTRGRARILYEMLEGRRSPTAGARDEVKEALDLCLSCKGCKGDCPVSVDMATYKAEFLSHHYKGRPRPRAAYSMGLIMFHARLAARLPRLANRITHAPGLGAALKRAGGLSPEREMPRFAEQTFKDWFARTRRRQPAGRARRPLPRHLQQLPPSRGDEGHGEGPGGGRLPRRRSGAGAVLRAPALRLRDARHRQGLLAADARRAGAAHPRRHAGGRGRAELRRRLPRRAAGPDAA